MSQAGPLNAETAPIVATTYVADSGSAMPIANIIEFLGTALQGISSSASGNTVIYTIADATTSQKGVSELATNAETIGGSVSNTVVTPSSLAAKLGDQTQDSIAYGNTTSGAIQWLDPLTDGQLVIGSFGNAPVGATLTAGAGVTITNGPGSINISATSSVAITFDADTGSATPAANVITIAGDATQGSVTSATGSTVTITNSDATETQKGVSELATDAESIAGSDTTRTIVPSSLSAKLGSQTSNAMAYGGGTTSALQWTSALTDGQLVIGSTAGNPAAATLTAGTNVTITNGANSISISATGGSAGFVWNEVTVTGPTSMAVNEGYIANNAGTVQLTLPSTASVGDAVAVVGKGAGGWQIQQNAGQTIHTLLGDTTTGATGTASYTSQYNILALLCITANTDWVVLHQTGTVRIA